MDDIRDVRALVIEDLDDVARMIEMVLATAGCVVECAAGSDEAAALVATPGGFDVVICDVRLPGIAGPVLIERLGFSLSATVFVSGSPRDELLGTSSEIPAGATFVKKPFLPSDLVAAVVEVLADRSD